MTIIDARTIIDLFLIICAVLFGIIIYMMVKKSLTNKESSKHDDINKSYSGVLKGVHKHAQKIIKKTTNAAAGILTESRQTNEKLEEELDQVLQNIAAKNIHALNTESAQFQKDYKQKLDEIKIAMDEKYAESLNQFTANLMTKTTSSYNEIDEKTKELMEQVNREVEEYKKERLSKAKNDIENLIQKTYTDVLHKSLSEEINEELIIQSLDNAKRDGILRI